MDTQALGRKIAAESVNPDRLTQFDRDTRTWRI